MAACRTCRCRSSGRCRSQRRPDGSACLRNWRPPPLHSLRSAFSSSSSAHNCQCSSGRLCGEGRAGNGGPYGVLDRSFERCSTWPGAKGVESSRGRIGVGIDALSDVLKTVRLNGAIVFDIDAYAPWGVETPPPRLFAPLVMPEADHIIEYHVITEGCCYASVAGEQPVRVEAGTVVMFPQGDAQVLSNPAGLRRKFELEEFEQARRATPQLPIGIVTPGNGEHTHIV